MRPIMIDGSRVLEAVKTPSVGTRFICENQNLKDYPTQSQNGCSPTRNSVANSDNVLCRKSNLACREDNKNPATPMPKSIANVTHPIVWTEEEGSSVVVGRGMKTYASLVMAF